MAQQLFAKIKRNSKYYGQTKPGAVFEVEIVPPNQTYNGYLVIGGPGGRYRLADVNLFVFGDNGQEVRIA